MTHQISSTPQFYLTAPQPCPYLPHRFERKVFTHLVGDRAADMNDLLTQGGFRRSQNIAYRPACETCRSCVSTRVLVQEFQRSENMQRIWRKNADLVGKTKIAEPTSEQYSLFRHYLDSRHGDGGMANMSVMDYAMMVQDSHVNTSLIEYRMRGPDSFLTGEGTGDLIAVALTDVMADGLSMVYSFFKTELEKRSLGTFIILDHIERARLAGKPHVYLGYWVEGSPKMSYKTRYFPQEHLGPTGWTLFDSAKPNL
jgi:leucyl-tRNA---protein transferase